MQTFSRVTAVFETFIKREAVVRFTYEKSNTKRLFSPLEMRESKDGRKKVYGWDHHNKAYRQFFIDNITELRVASTIRYYDPKEQE